MENQPEAVRLLVKCRDVVDVNANNSENLTALEYISKCDEDDESTENQRPMQDRSETTKILRAATPRMHPFMAILDFDEELMLPYLKRHPCQKTARSGYNRNAKKYFCCVLDLQHINPIDNPWANSISSPRWFYCFTTARATFTFVLELHALHEHLIPDSFLVKSEYNYVNSLYYVAVIAVS
ncbi:hypothetical protein SCA6_000387 [Theobroma cacao]